MPLVQSFSGVRGIYDNGLDEQVALRYGYCFTSFLKKKYGEDIKIVIGTDTRPSRDILKKILLESIGADIIDVGIASTPQVEFCVRKYKAQGGIIITASHNEPYWNGFKFLDSDGGILSAEDMDGIIKHYERVSKLSDKAFSKKYLFSGKNKEKIISKNIAKKEKESDEAYIQFVLSFLSKKDIEIIKKSKLKIVLDPNGGTGVIAKQVLDALSVGTFAINMEHGIFNRIVEPSEHSLFYLSNHARNNNADFAAGFDCDADRVEIMTTKGIVSGNHLLGIIADSILSKSKNKVIVVNNATSLLVRDVALKHKAEYSEVEVGETNVVSAMYAKKAPVGGEGSSAGVIIPPNRCRDGVVTLVYLLKIMAETGKTIHDLVAELPTYFNLKDKVEIDSRNLDVTIKKIQKYYSKKKYKIEISKVGSVKVYPDSNSFVWFRGSKTEAGVFRIITDSQSGHRSEELLSEALTLLKQ